MRLIPGTVLAASCLSLASCGGDPLSPGASLASTPRPAPPAYGFARGHAVNRRYRLRLDLDARGLALSPRSPSAGWTFRPSPSRWGCDGALAELPPASPTTRRHRAEYDRGVLREWYENGPLGVEQGFTLPSPPRCAGEVVIELADLGLDPEVSPRGDAAELRDPSGRAVLHYTDLHVVDATGRALPARLSRTGSGLALRYDGAGALYPVEVDPLMWTEQARLSETGAMELGEGVAIDGDTAAVGESGMVEVYVRSGDTWTLQQSVTAADGATDKYFGPYVALSGDTMLVGASSGVYVFDRAGSTWTQTDELPVNPVSIALSGDTALLGTQVFTRSAGAWSQEVDLATLVPEDDDLGVGIAISGETIVLGAVYQYDTRGAAYAFTRGAGVWSPEEFTASGLEQDQYFGESVALDGDTAVVGAQGLDFLQGRAFAFARTSGGWVEQQELHASDGEIGDFFGFTVAVSGDVALVGDDRDDGGGLLHMFTRSGSAWTERPEIVAKEHVLGDEYGNTLAMSGSTVIVGAPGDDAVPGAAYVFAIGLPCAPADPSACPAPDACHGPAACDPTTLLCGASPALPDGAPCSTGVCEAGACVTMGSGAGGAACGEGCRLTGRAGLCSGSGAPSEPSGLLPLLALVALARSRRRR